MQLLPSLQQYFCFVSAAASEYAHTAIKFSYNDICIFFVVQIIGDSCFTFRLNNCEGGYHYRCSRTALNAIQQTPPIRMHAIHLEIFESIEPWILCICKKALSLWQNACISNLNMINNDYFKKGWNEERYRASHIITSP